MLLYAGSEKVVAGKPDGVWSQAAISSVALTKFPLSVLSATRDSTGSTVNFGTDVVPDQHRA